MLKHGSASFGGPVRSKNSIYAYVLFHHLPCPLHSTYQPVGRARHAPPRHTNAGAQVELPGGPMSQDHGSHSSSGEDGHAEDVVLRLEQAWRY